MSTYVNLKVNVPLELYRKVQARCVLEDQSMGTFVHNTIHEALREYNKEKRRRFGNARLGKGVRW